MGASEAKETAYPVKLCVVKWEPGPKLGLDSRSLCVHKRRNMHM